MWGDDTPFIVLSDDNGTVAQRTQNAGRIRPEHVLTQEQWDTFVVGVHRIAQSVRDETGLRTVFHHHCGGYVENTCGGGHVNAANRSEFGGVVFLIRGITDSVAVTRLTYLIDTLNGYGMCILRIAILKSLPVLARMVGITFNL